MRYQSVYKKSNGRQRVFILMALLLAFIPAAGIVMLALSHGKPHSSEQWILLFGLTGSGIISAGFTYWSRRRMSALSVEVNDIGLQHTAPGREKTFLWQDLIEAKKVSYSKGQVAMQVRTATMRYVFPPDMVPDTPDAPELRFSFPKQYWLFPDGTREPADFEHCFGYKIVTRYRPDLLKGRLKPSVA
jgi:hypothetical protein